MRSWRDCIVLMQRLRTGRALRMLYFSVELKTNRRKIREHERFVIMWALLAIRFII
jgi:hypothetical protein